MADLQGAEDLQEEEVWAVMKSTRDQHQQSPNSKTRKHSPGSSSSSSPSAWRFTAASSPMRTISRRSNSAAAGGGGIHREFSAPPRQQSAPMDIPDWSKILKKKSNSNKNLWDDACTHDDDGDGRKSQHVDVGFNGHHDDGDGDDDDEMVPPHEYLARRLASTQIASFSMCEGVGRTLKGRDLSKLRNAILTKTGFLE